MHGIFSPCDKLFAQSGTLLGSGFSACFLAGLCSETVARAQLSIVQPGAVLQAVDSGQAKCVQYSYAIPKWH